MAPPRSPYPARNAPVGTTTGTERWRLRHEGVEHEVEIVDLGLRRSVTWRLAGDEVGSRRTTDRRLVLDGGERGAVDVRLPKFLGPARRVTWYSADHELGAGVAAHVGLGGIDLVPEPGSKAAAREAWIRAHPGRYVARRTAAALAGVLVPLLVFWLLARIHVPWPQLSIPWPDWDLPTIPWPDLEIPWPDWELPHLPEWVHELIGKLKYVWPLVLAYGVARAEVRRRRQQDRRTRPDTGEHDAGERDAGE